MNCSICQTELIVTDSSYEDFNNIECPTKDHHMGQMNGVCPPKIIAEASHYKKYILDTGVSFNEIENICLFPFLIRNIFEHYHKDIRLGKDMIDVIPAYTNILCYVFKYNSGYNSGYKKVLDLSYHIKPDIEDKLRKRIKLLLLLS